MSTRKKKSGRRKANKEAHKCVVWPPEDWPEEEREAYANAAQELFSEFLADAATRFSPFPPSAEILPFRRPEK